MAARAIVFGAVGTAGQRCTSTRRLFVQKEAARDLMVRLLSAYRSVRIGDPLDTVDKLDICVGGLPLERRLPFEYKVPFAPADVIEEYTRGATLPSRPSCWRNWKSAECGIRRGSKRFSTPGSAA